MAVTAERTRLSRLSQARVRAAVAAYRKAVAGGTSDTAATSVAAAGLGPAEVERLEFRIRHLVVTERVSLFTGLTHEMRLLAAADQASGQAWDFARLRAERLGAWHQATCGLDRKQANSFRMRARRLGLPTVGPGRLPTADPRDLPAVPVRKWRKKTMPVHDTRPGHTWDDRIPHRQPQYHSSGRPAGWGREVEADAERETGTPLESFETANAISQV